MKDLLVVEVMVRESSVGDLREYTHGLILLIRGDVLLVIFSGGQVG